LDRLGITLMTLAETLDGLDELMSSKAVEVTVVQADWKLLSRALGSRVPARFSDLTGGAGAEEGLASMDSHLHAILEADAAELSPLLEIYIRDHLARAMGTSPARIDTQQSLLSLGLDSLIALEVRNRVNADLGINVPLTKLMQSESINALAAYVAERILEDRGESFGAPVAETILDEKTKISLSATDAEDLLDRIDELTDEEVDRHLSVLQTQEQP
jgi:acyl carrier protein